MNRSIVLTLALLVACSSPPESARPATGGDSSAPTATRPGAGGRMGGRMGGGMGGRMGGMRGSMMGAGGTAPETEAAQASAPGCPDVDQALVDQGRLVFTGAGGCAACHAADATGTQLGPNLTDRAWLDADGSYGSIAATVRSGVPSPRQYPAPMPAMGGAQLTTAQVCAVAGYVYSRSH